MFQRLFIFLFLGGIFWLGMAAYIILYKIECPEKTIKQILEEL